ncbi:MAG: 4Fe-4S dicluster domain-containing protein [Candidatus Hodarchaeales archaeon]|jgi:heterodisulfide reductase subunit C
MTVGKVLQLSKRKLENEFVIKIQEWSGQNIFSCYWCGKCSAGCMMVSDEAGTDIMPHEVIRRIQLGDETVLDSQLPWLCASCEICSIRCPRGIDVAKVMEAVRQWKQRKHEDKLSPSSIDPAELARLPQIAIVGAFRKKTS